MSWRERENLPNHQWAYILLAIDSGMIGCELEREGELAEPPGGIPPLGAEVNLYLSAGRASG